MASDPHLRQTPLKQKEGQFQLDGQADDDYWGIFEPLEHRCKADEAVVYTYQMLPPEVPDDDSNAGNAGSGGNLSDIDEDGDDDSPDAYENRSAAEPPAPTSSPPKPTRSSTFNLPPKGAGDSYAIRSQSVVFKLIEHNELSLTPPGGLLALEFPTCNPDLAEKLLDSATHQYAGFNGASSILLKDKADSFFGVRVHGRAAAGADLASSVLLVSLPLLGELEKAWFLVFNNVAVATFLVRPAEHPSVYPGQVRDTNGAFVFLVNCISAVLGRNSRSQGVEQRIQECSAHLRSIQGYLTSDKIVERPELRKFESYLGELLTIADCFRLQLKVLRRLHSLLQSAVHKAAAKATGRKSSTDKYGHASPETEHRSENLFTPPPSLRTSITIPCISEQSEQMPDVLMALEYLVDQRVGFLNDIQETEGRLRPRYELLLQLNAGRNGDVRVREAGVLAESGNGSQALPHGSGGTASTQAPPISGNTGSSSLELSLHALVQSGANTASRLAFIREELSYQGELFSFFTVITTIFLPLSFFATYFALDAFDPRIHSESDFWVITGIVTGLFSAMITLMIGAKRYHFWSLGKFVLSLLLCPVYRVFRPQPKQREDQEIRKEVQMDFDKVVTTEGTTTTGTVVPVQNTEDPLQTALELNRWGRFFQKRLKRLFRDGSGLPVHQ